MIYQVKAFKFNIWQMSFYDMSGNDWKWNIYSLALFAHNDCLQGLKQACTDSGIFSHFICDIQLISTRNIQLIHTDASQLLFSSLSVPETGWH